ncbi:hypothetical protein [Burkholderia cenocepacia]|uniref:hypothetical protein n=1 Tax=Burkholderia cenocepacia TaxID=95486 RepID=UPI002B246DC8|nr:hypothetical protein [Burkholderia cenocepacia]MEB2499549.1 hypothetical protein [Burkholderia cenocepacia]MEB2557224.1 hypothetical protein [Burkholderia cenocepacia]
MTTTTAHGGKRSGAGRKRGAVTRISQEARERAAQTGELPHEFLLRVVRGEDAFFDSVQVNGESVEIQRKPTFAERVDAAKAAAPYFQPRLAATEIEHRGGLSLDRLAESVTPETNVAVAKELLRQEGYEFED